MGQWAVIGEVKGIPEKVSWNGTSLSGTPAGIQAVHEYLALFKTVPVTPTGPSVDANINDETSAFLLALCVLASRVAISGDPPDISALVPDLPEGAIA